MRVCPKCGYVDEPYWLHTKFSYYIDQCRYENFRLMFPQLAEQIFKERKVQDANYVYRLSKNNRVVMRKALIDYGLTFADLCEKGDFNPKKDKPSDVRGYWNREPPTQKKLLDVKP